jgi:hypothetical protein
MEFSLLKLLDTGQSCALHLVGNGIQAFFGRQDILFDLARRCGLNRICELI